MDDFDFCDPDMVTGAVIAQLEDLEPAQRLEVVRDVLAGLLADDADRPLEVEIIESALYNLHQSWWLKRIVMIGGNRYRVEIRRNAYDAQSYAKVEAWTTAGWSVVESLPITACASESVSYVDRSPDASLFEADADRLLRAAVAVVA